MGITSIILSLLSWQVISVTIVTLIIYYYLKCSKQMAGYPPGPFPLPLIGNLHLLRGDGESIQAKVTELSKIYGPLMTLWLGRKPMIVASDGETAKIILITKGRAFAGRPEMKTMKSVSSGIGVGSADYGDEWKRNRRLVHTAIQVEGAKFQYLHDLVMDDINDAVNNLISLNGKPFNPKNKVHFLFVSIVCKLMFDITIKEESEEYKRLTSISASVREGLRKSLFRVVMSRMPFAQKPSIEPFKRFFNAIKELTDAYIEQEKLRLESGDTRRNMSLAKIMQDEKKEDASFTVEQWPAIFGDLYIAASDSSYNITSWALLYMVSFPEKQLALQENIDRNWGNKVDPLYLQKDNFPYVEAVWYETERFSTVISLGLPHKTLQDTMVSGHMIKKDTNVFVNHHGINYDSKQWGDPDVFRPERFINDKGKFQIPCEHFYPFSAGTRSCIGQSFGKMEQFLIVVNLFRKFHFSLPTHAPKPSFLGNRGFSYEPKEFEVIATLRN